MPVLLLLLFSIALSIGTSIVVLVLRRSRWKAPRVRPLPPGPKLGYPAEPNYVARRPGCWLAIKSHNLLAVQKALGLHNPKPCSCLEGMASEETLFIAPPVRGWILVMGTGLPEPSDDVDVCFRFLMDLSRQLGQVQFFSASRILQHHAWIKTDTGRVQRAYAWAGRTLWQQGKSTPAERDLDLKCFDYVDSTERPAFGQSDLLGANVDKVPLLAARWSLDPASLDERWLEHERGVAGKPSRRY
jgi:hypothetical protein